MTLVDWIVIIVIAAAVLGGLAEGFFRSACGVAGLIAGLVIAAWNYQKPAEWIIPLVRIPAVANTILFLLISILVMALFALLGNLLARALRLLGLGCLDRLAGAIFGFFQGALAVIIGIVVIVAFFPQVHWIADARVPRMFFGACHLSANLTPDELAKRVRSGLNTWENKSPEWLHPKQAQ